MNIDDIDGETPYKMGGSDGNKQAVSPEEMMIDAAVNETGGTMKSSTVDGGAATSSQNDWPSQVQRIVEITMPPNGIIDKGELKSMMLVEEEPARVARRLHRIEPGVAWYTDDHYVLISDSACDQSIATCIWTVLIWTGRHVLMTGAFAGRNVGEKFPVVSAACKMILENGTEYALIGHEMLYDKNKAQHESLLSVHQSCSDPKNRIDDRSPEERNIHGHPGTQKASFNGTELPFYFDGCNCFYEIAPITEAELETFPQVIITPGGKPYEPKRRITTRRLPSSPSVPGTDIESWRERLAFCPQEVVKKTLAATTQMVASVEAETREIMRDHLQTRLPELKRRRINDECATDTFFSSVKSVRGYTMFQLFSFRKARYDVPYLMRKRSDVTPKLLDLCREVGVPRVILSDNAPEVKSSRWNKACREMFVEAQRFSEAEHQNQDFAERRGGTIKTAVWYLLFVTGAPLSFWCYALEYVCIVRQHLANAHLDWRTPHEVIWNETPDISVFRFPFWCPVWYYVPKRKFPKSKMLPGRFVGIARNVGDAFCYLILTEPEDNSQPQVLARSVVRRRYPREDAPIVVDDAKGTLRFYKSDRKTRLEPHEDDSESKVLLDELKTIQEGRAPYSSVHHSHVSQKPDDDDDKVMAAAILQVSGPPSKRRRIDEVICSPTPAQAPNENNRAVTQDVTEESDATTQSMNPASAVLPGSSSTTPRDNPQGTGPAGELGVQNPVPEERDVPVVETVDDDEDEEGFDPFEASTVHPEILKAVNTDADEEDELPYDSIVGHLWEAGSLMLHVLWKTGDKSLLPFSAMKMDFPRETATYILDHHVESTDGQFKTGRYSRWARSFNRQLTALVRRIIRNGMATVDGIDGGAAFADLPESVSTDERIIRQNAYKMKQRVRARRSAKKTKPGRLRRPIKVKYGIEVPRDTKRAYEIDRENGNTLWEDAIKKEVASLLAMECFEFKEPGYKPSPDYQWTKLTMVYDVKSCLTRKARLVCGGHPVCPRDLSLRSTVVKTVSVRLLDLIAHRDGLTTLCGDVGNAFITADCLEKVYSRAGPEFGDKEGCILLIQKALYGFRSSSQAFRAHFAEFLRSMGFVPTRYDRDVWMRLRDDGGGYDYICTHVDDFKIVAKDPYRWLNMIKETFMIKSAGPPEYYLGNDYKWCESESAWILSCATYVKECVRRLEDAKAGPGFSLQPHKTPTPTDCHPELDTSELLDEKHTQQYQMLIGMAQWACTIGRLDISYAVSSLSRVSCAPREGYLALALYLFGYLKQHPNKRILLDSRPLKVAPELKVKSFHPDFLEDYPDAKEDFDPSMFPEAFGEELETSIFFDADHAHDQATRRSISGIILFVGSTPVQWHSKRQGCIATSTYCAEFVAMRTAVEEAISLRYMLRCLGCRVTLPTTLYGDNFGSIQSATIPDGELKKKHIAISYHYVRKAIAAQYINVVWVKSCENFADICTKGLGNNTFKAIVHAVMC